MPFGVSDYVCIWQRSVLRNGYLKPVGQEERIEPSCIGPLSTHKTFFLSLKSRNDMTDIRLCVSRLISSRVFRLLSEKRSEGGVDSLGITVSEEIVEFLGKKDVSVSVAMRVVVNGWAETRVWFA